MTTTWTRELSPLEERDVLVDALVSAQDRLSALVAMLKVSRGTLDLDELQQRVLVEALAVTGSDAAILRGAPGTSDHRASSGQHLEVEQLCAVLDERLEHQQLGTGDAAGMAWAVAPFPSGPAVGIAVGRLRGPAYTTGDIRMLDVVALAIEQLTELSRLHRELVRQTALEKEHQLASRLAQAVLRADQPRVPGIDLFARCTPAAATGGDFIVFVESADALWVAVGDVAGKGLPAAMIMTQAVAAARIAMTTSDPDDPAEALLKTGCELQDYLESVGSFVTLAVAAHRRGSRTITLANAGHSPVVHQAGPGEAPRSVGPTVPPIGVAVPWAPQSVSLPFDPGARLVIGTDGLVEQPDPRGEMLGYDVFVAACGSDTGSAAELGEQLVAQVERHGAGTPAADDRTLVVLRALGGPRA